MAKHFVEPIVRPHVNPQRFGLNGRLPNPASYRVIAQGFNRLATWNRRALGCWAGDLSNFPLAPATQTQARFCFRTGLNASKVTAMVGLAPAANAGATDPRVRMDVIHAGGTITGKEVRYYKIDTTPPPAPRDIFWARTSVDVSPDTLYRADFITAQYSYLAAVSLFEEAAPLADDSLAGCCDPTPFETEGAIYAGDVQKVVEAGTGLWQKNRTQILGWGCRDAATPTITINSATWPAGYANIFDATSTTVTAATPGFFARTQYRDSAILGGVPLEIGVYAQRTSGTGNLHIRIRDASGQNLAVRTNCGATPTVMHSAQQTFSAAVSAGTKYDIQADVTGTGVWELQSVGLWLYEP